MDNLDRFKVSKYNEYLGQIESRFVIFNNMTTGMVEVSREVNESLQSNDTRFLRNLNPNSALVKGGFVVPDELDETANLLSVRKDAEKYGMAIGLQILPTLNCNFACPYCYENVPEESAMMSREIMDAILGHVRQISTDKTESLVVSWFGGEPLLAMSQMQYLSERFLEFAEKKGLFYAANLVTNGYNMGTRVVSRLQKWHVTQVQVTLDGPREVHDQRRFLRSGAPTYEKILRNIRIAADAGMKITVRVNLDKTNIHSLKALLLDLEKRNLLGVVKISLSPVNNDGVACGVTESSLLESSDIIEQTQKKDIYCLMALQDKTDFRRLYPNVLGCVAESPSGLIITPDGTLYKCSKVIGDPDWACGNITSFDGGHPNFRRFVDASRYEIPQCKLCRLLPVCPISECVYQQVVLGEERAGCAFTDRHKTHHDSLIKIYKNARNEPCRTSNL